MHRSRFLGIAEDTTAAGTAVGGNGGGNGRADSTTMLEKRARVGYLIMASGVEELHKTKRLLQVLHFDADTIRARK